MPPDPQLHAKFHFKNSTLPVLVKGSPVHIAPAWAGSGEGSDHFESYVHSLSCIYARGCF
jgi:hypothetical protein